MKACESGWYVCDSSRKVATVGHLGGEEPVTVPVTRCSEMPDGWNFRLLSVGYHVYITHVPALSLIRFVAELFI